MAKDNIFFLLINVTPTNIFYDNRSIGVVGFDSVKLDDAHFNVVLCVPSISCNLLFVYQVTHVGEGKKYN
jgi:hypothetical protein